MFLRSSLLRFVPADTEPHHWELLIIQLEKQDPWWNEVTLYTFLYFMSKVIRSCFLKKGRKRVDVLGEEPLRTEEFL